MMRYRLSYELIGGGKACEHYNDFGDAFARMLEIFGRYDKNSRRLKATYETTEIYQWDEHTERYVSLHKLPQR